MDKDIHGLIIVRLQIIFQRMKENEEKKRRDWNNTSG
jgi:hypothetical protein